jgi:hypothetical protein
MTSQAAKNDATKGDTNSTGVPPNKKSRSGETYFFYYPWMAQQ